MSQCLFIHDFFQDGRLDVLAEIREMQIYGQWTKELRADWTKSARAAFQRSRYTHPRIPQGSSYYAGRIAGLRSAITARYPKIDPHGRPVFLSITPDLVTICAECGERAMWEWYPAGNLHLLTYLCDRCKQERARMPVLTGAFEQDWNEHGHSLRAYPVPDGSKLIVQKRLAPQSIFAPITASLGLGLLDISLHVPVPVLLLQILFVLHLTVKGKDYWQGFRKFFESEP